MPRAISLYNSPLFQPNLAEAEHLTSREVASWAGNIMTLAHEAYKGELEETGIVPPGTVCGYLDPMRPKLLRAYTEEASADAHNGSDYTIIRDLRYPWAISALAKIRAPRTIEIGSPDVVYIDEVLADQRRRGLGSVVLHAALTQPTINQDAALGVELFGGSPSNEFFTSLGLQKLSETTGRSLRQHLVTMEYYQTHEGQTVGDIAGQLERRMQKHGTYPKT
jgi:hypothetical protein